MTWLNVLDVGSGHEAIGSTPAKNLAGDHVVRAMRFVRGRTHHHWAQVVYFDPSTGAWLWQPTEVLPLADEGYDDRDAEAIYSRHLARRPVVDALERVRQLLAQV